MSPIIVRTLRHEFRLHVREPSLHDAFRFMEIAPSLPDFRLQGLDIEIVGKDGFCAMQLPDGSLVEGSAGHLMHVLHKLIFMDVVQSALDAVLVHGATVLIDGKRVFLVGHKGCGKTTFTLHLLARGHRIEGDEHLLVRSGDVVARPRTLRVKPGTPLLVPEIAGRTAAAPFIENWDGTRIWALSPATGDTDWIIRAGKLDAIIFLTANHGGRSVLDSLTRDQAFRRLLTEVIHWPTNVLAAASRLRSLLETVRTGEMLLGDLAGAEWHLKKLVSS